VSLIQILKTPSSLTLFHWIHESLPTIPPFLYAKAKTIYQEGGTWYYLLICALPVLLPSGVFFSGIVWAIVFLWLVSDLALRLVVYTHLLYTATDLIKTLGHFDSLKKVKDLQKKFQFLFSIVSGIGKVKDKKKLKEG